MVDKTRGEAAITLDGKDYTMVPTYAALAEIEGATDRGLIELLMAIGRKSIRTRELAVMVSSLVADLDEDAAGQAIVATGMLSVMEAMSPFWVSVCSGGYDANGDPKNAKAGRK